MPILSNNQVLQEVSSFKYLGVTLTKDGTSAKEIQIRIASATAAMTRLNVIWKSNLNFSPNSGSTSHLSFPSYSTVARHGFFWLKARGESIRILYTDRKTNDYVRETVGDLVGPYEPLLSTVKRRKQAWFGHVTRHDSLSKVILQRPPQCGRRRGCQRRNWSDNVKVWTGLDMPDLLATAANRSEWRIMSASTVLSPRRLHSHGTE
ncbi:hypothetical protein BSL78_14247 [Apostichopus japonicus]|uniref:RNA-directed DNA polymerase from mobile element jockey-like n=1 Tax=Stichopus japonicus TaxID=307972 RepID=A0A2G8KLJ6_STIJA|nr:hypothetical protein BSL78_14247 [Apostichopus japonicus]